MAVANEWRRCSRALDRMPHRCHMRRGFILLFTLTFLLSAIVFIADSYFKSRTFTDKWFNYAVNQINYYMVIKGHSANHNQTTTTTAQTTVTTEPTLTTVISTHYHIAYPRNYQCILDEPDICQQQNPFLVLMVPVAPNQLKARNAIRSTWGNESTVQGKTVLTLFVVGLVGGPDSEKAQQRLQEESRQHRDLVQSNFLDTYFNLTIKTMVIMDWLSTRCPQASYAMKVDSDMFLNVENLMSLLLAPNTPRENYITGAVMRNKPVIRNKHSKWYVSEEVFPESTYPTYISGTGYVFSNDLPKKIVEVSKNVKPFNIEDAYMGACLKQLGIPALKPENPSQFRPYLREYKRQEFVRLIATIVHSPQQLIVVWEDVKRST